MDYRPYFKISYGLYIISSGKKDNKTGYIANTVFQVTAEPPRLAVSCSKNNHSAAIIEETGAFGISVLRRDVKPQLFGTFGFRTGKDIDKFENCQYRTGSTGIPIVEEDSLSLFECKVINSIDLDTHILFIGDVIGQELLNDVEDPLTYAYYQEVKKGKAPKNAPTYVDPEKKR